MHIALRQYVDGGNYPTHNILMETFSAFFSKVRDSL
jgi:hypothetical protein